MIIHLLTMAKRGRDKELVSLRDEKLLRRWYYWTEVERLRFDDALIVLSRQEFFIAPDTIMAIIRENLHKIDDIKVKPMPRVKVPRITKEQLALFIGDD